MGATDDHVEIGQRARTIHRRRGLSVEIAAGLTGISKGYLSLLERGLRRFERRGLLEDLAGALGCSVADPTGSDLAGCEVTPVRGQVTVTTDRDLDHWGRSALPRRHTAQRGHRSQRKPGIVSAAQV